MDTTQIAALLEPFLEQPLSQSQFNQISTYIDLLQRWNALINLTAIRTEDEIVTRHFGESFFLARHLFPYSSNICHPERTGAPIASAFGAMGWGSEGPASRLPSIQDSGDALSKLPLGAAFGGQVSEDATGNLSSFTESTAQPTDHRPPPTVHCLDIGSGAGFPALPLKIWAHHIHLTLIESNHKKAAFLQEVARALTLTNINVITDRAETVSAQPGFEPADIVTLRAVEHFEKILPQAEALLAPNGTLALLIGSAQLPHLTTLTTLKWHPPISIPESHSRVLSIGVRG